MTCCNYDGTMSHFIDGLEYLITWADEDGEPVIADVEAPRDHWFGESDFAALIGAQHLEELRDLQRHRMRVRRMAVAS